MPTTLDRTALEAQLGTDPGAGRPADRRRALRRPDQPEPQGDHTATAPSSCAASAATPTCSASTGTPSTTTPARPPRPASAPEVVDYRPDLGMLVIGFIEGVTYDNDSFAVPGTLPRVAAAIRGLHSGPRFVNDFDMFARQRALPRAGARARVRPPARVRRPPGRLPPGARRAGRARRATVPCNNDLLAGNFVDDGSKVWLIDYEYSGNNDAVLRARQHQHRVRPRPPTSSRSWSTSYFGAPLRNKLARTRLQALVAPVRLVAVGRDPGRRAARSTSTSRAGGWSATRRRSAASPATTSTD